MHTQRYSFRTHGTQIAVAILIIAAIGGYVWVRSAVPQVIVINEISYADDSGIDWIELYNPTLHTRTLQGMYLTDDAQDFTQFAIDEEIVIPPLGFVVIYGDKANTVDGVEANFRVSAGETVYLIDTDGSTLLDSLTILDEEEGMTYGRFPDASEHTALLAQATPGEQNGE